MIIALALIGTLLASTSTGSTALTGKMAVFDDLLGPTWTCTLGTFKYFAAYAAGPGNTLHGHLYSPDSSEDTYFGYDAQRKLYWIDSADTTGATESQTSSDGMTFVGTLNDGGTISKATNTYTISSASKWLVHALGSAGGHPYDVTATCVRSDG
jgi:hypothetical protein